MEVVTKGLLTISWDSTLALYAHVVEACKVISMGIAEPMVRLAMLIVTLLVRPIRRKPVVVQMFNTPVSMHMEQ